MTFDHVLKVDIPPNWVRVDIPAFGFVSALITANPNLARFVTQLRSKFLAPKWASITKDMALHSRFTNVFLMCGISTPLLLPPAVLPDKLAVRVPGELHLASNIDT